MTPTNKLRYVNRRILKDLVSDSIGITEIRPVLQQWWFSTTVYGEGEWRDVPTEEETK